MKKKQPGIPQPKGLSKKKEKAAQDFIDGKTEINKSINTDLNTSINSEETPPIKVMFTLPPDQADGLGIIQAKLRSMVGERRGQVNRSVIVRAALEMFASDFDKNGESGEGYRLIAKLIS